MIDSSQQHGYDWQWKSKFIRPAEQLPGLCGAGDFFVFSFIFVWGTGFDAEALCIIARAPGFQYFIPDTVKPGIISKYTIKDYLFTVKIQDLIEREEW